MVYQNIIGVDTSKREIVTSLHGSKIAKTFSNDLEGFVEFRKAYDPVLSDCLVVVESTGGYERAFQAFLFNATIASHKASGRQIKNFMRSYGVFAKTDVIDAKAIAQYGFERQSTLRLYSEKPSSRRRLNDLIMRRNDLVQMLVCEKNRKKAPCNESIIDGIARHIAYLESELSLLEEELSSVIASNEELKKTVDVITEIDGIGKKSGASLVAMIPELGTLNRRQVASLCGVAPQAKQSGAYRGYARTYGGRRQIRPMLYLCAMAAARSKGQLGQWYRALVMRGKKPLVALVALMRKIIVIANAKVRDANKKLLAAQT